MSRVALAVLMMLILRCAEAEETAPYLYRIWFTDKNHNTCSTERPEEFLSAKAIERRERQGIEITEEDLPPSEHYITEVLKRGGKAICRSRWLNTVVVASGDARLAAKLKKLPFVKKAEKIYEKEKEKGGYVPNLQYGETDSTCLRNSIYGYSQQAETLNGAYLHSIGYRGQGITIAVLDAGFADADKIPEYIDAARIKGEYDVVNPGGDIYAEHAHGTSVLSIMAAGKRGEFVGCAPEADYILIRTEYFNDEFRQEEDFWVRGAEYADSIGADIINSSLGYSSFDATRRQYAADDRDGNTAVISRGADAAARKGIAVIVGAGNNGHGGDAPLPFPSDADGILSVGSCNAGKAISAFSSGGYTSDGRIKPEVTAPGENIPVLINGGRLVTASGTSYSAPAVAGLTACLMQALPQYGAKEIIRFVKESADRFTTPAPPYGYGIPDFKKAVQSATASSGATGRTAEQR